MDVVTLGPDDVVHTISYDAFNTPRPLIFNGQNIPPDIQSAMQPAWGRREYPASHATAYRILDAIITMEGLVFDQKLRPVAQTITQHNATEIDLGRAGIESIKPQYVSGSSLLLRKRGEQNYGHWLIEIAPRLQLMRDTGLFQSVIIPKTTGRMLEVVNYVVEKLLPPNILVFAAGLDDVIHVEHLIVLDGISAHGVFMSPLALAATNKLGQGIQPAGTELVFLSRGPNETRQITNISEVTNLLSRRGFHFLTATDYAFEEQMALFKSARMIVGVLGAALTNMAFAEAGARIINLAPMNMPDTFYYFLAAHKKHNYTEIRCNQLDKAHYDHPISIPIEELNLVLGLQ